MMSDQSIPKEERVSIKIVKYLALWLGILLTIAGCMPQKTIQPGLVSIEIQVDSKQVKVEEAAGSTVQAILNSAGVTLNNLDRIEPPSFTLVTGPTTIRVIRVKEVFENEDTILPFSYQTVKNESLPEGKQLLVQPGSNGLQQITYRQVIEDGVEVSRTAVKSVIVTAIPLLLFANGVRQVPLSTVGLIQYIAPTLQFLLGVLVYAEPFGPERMVGFSLIWLALIIFSAENLLNRRRQELARA